MGQLEFVTPTDTATLNVLLYGAAKTGKTMGAASAPGPILYLNADRPNATRFAHSHADAEIKEVRFTGLQSMIDVVNELTQNADDWATVVVDPIGELHTALLDDLSGHALRPAINLRGDSGTHLERFCRSLCDLPVNTVFVAHEFQVEDEDTLERIPFTTSKKGSPVFAAKLAAMVDVIGYTAVLTEEGATRYAAQLISANGRLGGSRFASLGKVRDVNISEWIEMVHQELSSEGNGKE